MSSFSAQAVAQFIAGLPVFDLPVVKAIKPHLTIFNLTVVSVIGAMTAGFAALVVVLIIIATNFNVLGLIE